MRRPRAWGIKGFALVATSLMVLVAFSQTVGPPASATSSDGDTFEEQARRLTVADGSSGVPRLAAGVRGAVHLAWIDGRSGSLGVYEKTTRDDGFTFTGDRPLAAGFRSISDIALASLPADRSVAVAWSGAVGSDPSRVYVRASADDGATWGRPSAVGPGNSAALAAVSGQLLLSYVYRNGSAPIQVRLVSLSLSGNGIRGGRGLLALNATSPDVALVAAGGLAHVVWSDVAAGVTVLAHVSVNPATGGASPVHVIGAFRATLSGRLALVGQGSTLAVFWSDDYGGTIDVKSAVSLDAGATWSGADPVAAGTGSQASPAAAFGPDVIAVAWQDDASGRWQVSGRLFDSTRHPLTAAHRISSSSTGATAPAVGFGRGSRDLVVAWSDSRDGASEIYADLDVLLVKPRAATMGTYVRRLADPDFAPPSGDSKATMLGLIAQARERVERREEARAADFLRTRVMVRFDGSFGNDPSDDLVVNATAQGDLMSLANGILDLLENGGSRGTRSGEPDPPPNGEGGDPTPEPIPGSGGTAGAKPVVTDVAISSVRATQAIVTWTVFSPDVPITGSFVDWGLASTSEHRSWDNTTPYLVSISPLTARNTYKVRAGAKYGSNSYVWSNTYTVFTGVALDGITPTNVSSNRATIEWTTNIPATSAVSYGKNESNLVNASTGASGTFHQVNLTGLGLRETYYYRVTSVSTDDATLSNESGTFSFETVMRITNLTHTETLVAGLFNITFTWDTNFLGTSQVRYGTNTTLMNQSVGTSGTHHSVVVSGLQSKTPYYWQVYSAATNGSGIYAVDAGSAFTGIDSRTGNATYVPRMEPKSESVTGSAPIVTWAISIVNVTFDRQGGSITAKWNTSYRANAVLEYKTGSNGWTTISTYASESSLTHSVLVSGLSSWTTYTFLLNSTSSSNPADTASSGNRNATTKNIVITQTPVPSVIIYDAWVNWTTSVTGSSLVRFGIKSIWEYTTTGQAGSSHSVHLAGLLPDTTYTYRVESAAQANPNDVVVDIERTLHTNLAENDANTSADAGGAFSTATHIEPGMWTGWVNPSFEDRDFFKFQAFANQQIHVKLTMGSGYDLNLHLWKPSGAWARSSNTTGPESITYDVGSNAGFWRIEVRLASGSNRCDYTLTFNATGGGVEKFVVDVGYPFASPQDTNNTAQTPGISIGTNWSSPTISIASSTALDKYIDGTRPDYRSTSANGTFYLNLHRTSWERYNDYLFTLQYYSTADTNVSVWNGAGWVTLAVVPGQSNWRAFSFVLEHTLFYDAEPAWPGMNVKLRFEKSIQVDLIAAIPWTHTTYVGSGSDDQLDEYHLPGIRLLDGWVNAGQGYKNATASGGTIVVTVPDTAAGYLVRMRFDGNSSGITVQRWTGSQWAVASSASNFSAGQALFVMDPAWYVDAYATWPGMNVKLRLVPTNRLNETTQFSLEPVHWTTDVGVAGDNVTTNHVPGLSVYSSSKWGGPSIDPPSGRTVRVGQTLADLYLNLPWPTGSMIAYVTYNATASGTVELYDGQAWRAVGQIVGDSKWRTAVLFAQGSAVTQGSGGGDVPGDVPRMFHDHYGDAFVNADLRFNLLVNPSTITLDAMWVDVDPDGDNLTSFGEPNPYAYLDATTHTLQFGQNPTYLDVNWEVLTEGRWQFDLSLSLFGWFDSRNHVAHFSGVTASVDGVEFWSVHKYVTKPASGSFPGMLCTGPHKLRIASNGDQRVDVTLIAFRKLPTDPDNPDTDGDGLRDGREACGKRTDPTQADTDSDGLNDYEEVYAFNYNNATSSAANVTVNITMGAVGEYHWLVKTSATVSGSNPVQANVYLDGQLKFSKKSSSAWTENVTTFDAILPKGLHSLQVQKATALGTVTLKLVNVTKPSITNALYWDTDKDGVSDGDEVLGKAGWMTSPTKWDTDGDWASDGSEINTLHTDPLLKDTDYDGVVDGRDTDPLYDLVVQLTATRFWVENGAAGNYQARVTVGPNWTNSRPIGPGVLTYVYHNLSVNVRDDASAPIKIQVFKDGVTEIDVSTQPGQKAYTATVGLKDPDVYNRLTEGDETTKAHLWFDVKVVRVGKANTLLMAPNDWSTLSNGTVDGRPTGLHRYVGEQRFVFGLLNVTDGDGDLVSYDVETRLADVLGGTYYNDFSGNGLYACHSGDSLVPGYFGVGTRLSGSGSFLSPCSYGVSDKLNWINGSFTVAAWVKPDTDYVSGTGWNWSFGRQGLWRLGFYGPAQGLRFEVVQLTQPYSTHFAQAVYPLYSGRWYHLAATMSTIAGRTNLSAFVNGNLIAWKNETAYAARDGTADLYFGWDQAAGPSAGRFKGTVDEIRLYKTALSRDGVRGLLWFLKGSNSVLIPRGVFYDSKLYGKLNGTFDGSSPFAGATAYGNSNTLSSNLNGRVIQMVIAKNLTLAQAWGILDLARTQNKTGNVTAFPFFATSEFYTLGFSWEVSKLAANTSVVNGGNYSVPPPPPSAWQLFWNAIAGWAERVWNAAVAVGAFFTNVGKWLVHAALAYVKGLTTGNWTDFQDQVLKPFVEAFEKLIQWILDFFNNAFSVIFAPVIQAWNDYISGVSRSATFIFTRRSCAPIECDAALAFRTFADTVMAPGFFYVVLALMIFLKVAGAWVAAATAGLTSLAQKIGESVIPMIVGALFGLAVGFIASATSWIIEEVFFASVPESSNLWKEQRAVGLLSLVSIMIQWILSWPSIGLSAPVEARAIILAVVGLFLGFAALAVKGDEMLTFLLAGFGLVLSVVGLLLASKKILKTHFADEGLVNAFEFVPPALTLVLFLMNIANFVYAATQLIT